ncbi:Mitochondrial import inner membrane translocase subunit Tim9 [Perkinsus olseni]|uniref:Mitochondrial import inner membrane translocase subunit Tim9 n=1 Tax=Perkinsus olseni TaxID=32597 RepID=A0A7J6RDV9_PEROL|nr:Mitochondrial import inner membrane translocase subunit Tim9 [Perkinsus olseni]
MASLPNLGNLTPADQAMVNKEMQDMQVNESLQTYNGLVERCFNQCIQNFRAKNLDYEETDCVKRCVGKFMTYSQRVGTRFAEKNQQVAQDQQAAAAAAATAGHPYTFYTTMANGMTVEESLSLKKIDTHLFLADKKNLWLPRGAKGVFGGQVIGQALVAATDSVPSHPAAAVYSAHSVHCYFILPGDPQADIIYYVENLRDGRSFLTRSVEGRQNGKVIFKMMVQFHTFEEGSPHLTYSIPMPEVKYQPEELIPLEYVAARIASQDYHRLPHGAREFLRKYSDDSVPVDRRPVAELHLKRPKRGTAKKGLNDFDNLIPNHLMLDDSKPKHEMAKRQFWLRARGDVGNTDAAHKSVLAYMSDFNLIATSLEPLGGIFCNTG